MWIFKRSCFTLILSLLIGCSNPNGVSLNPVQDTVTIVRVDTVEVQRFDPRQCLINKSFEYVGIREETGNNDGPMIRKFLAFVGFEEGFAWCAAIMSEMYHACGVTNAPISAWSPDWDKAGKVIWQQGDLQSKARMLVKSADHFTIHYASKGRVGHVGMVVNATHSLNTFEGNTNDGGSREGDGTYFRVRPYSQIYKINRLIHD
ncbi:MAG: hypothetical protein VYB44_07045 [Bacteroidota bacterium]|nr:hypothetical protein [Bacteroidota bacterium]